MADDGTKQNTTWPLPKFTFAVRLGDDEARFQEVSGLDAENKSIEFRHGDNPNFSPIKMPGILKDRTVTLRKGIFARDAKFWKWFSEIGMNNNVRRTVVIQLLDESGEPKMTWTLLNAWPTKITGTDLKSEGNEVAVELIELGCELVEAKTG